jgi:hypothetical protein
MRKIPSPGMLKSIPKKLQNHFPNLPGSGETALAEIKRQ